MKIDDKILAVYANHKAEMEGVLHYMHPQNSQKLHTASFKKRRFKLMKNLLFYFRTDYETEPLGLLVLENVTVHHEKPFSGAIFPFSIEFCDEPHKKHYFSCRNVAEACRWVEKLNESSYEYWRTQLLILQQKISVRTGCEANIHPFEQPKKMVKKVPKGWSDYQAAWIPDVDTELASDNSEDDDDEMDYSDAVSDEGSDLEDEHDFKTVTESEFGIADERYDEQFDLHEEMSDLEKIKQAKSDLMFPDEVDTPQNLSARERFQRYRGLESFRTSPWDPKENLPLDFARIFQFENFDRTKRRILKEEEEKQGAMSGWYVTIHIKNVSQSLWNQFSSANSPVVIIGLFPHEHKMSVLNVVLKRTPNYELPIKSKERLVFQCGYRRFIVNPIFSQHTNGKKHKYERFFQPETTSVATFFGPIQFPPAPVLCYLEKNGKLILVATGSLMSVNPDRIIVKRVVLSGHPFKVYKRSAVIRFMFFNREDIVYFKPVKLRTKHGRIGHIKEPLGTHGHMKCVFDGQLKSQDTVLMNLYKRMFPKWTYEECIVSCPNTSMESNILVTELD